MNTLSSSARRSLLTAALLAGTALGAHAQTATPINTTGYNADVIYEAGASTTSPSPGTTNKVAVLVAGTGSTLDTAPQDLFETGYNGTGGTTGPNSTYHGLPTGNTAFTSASNGNTVFQYQSYTGNNDLGLTPSDPTAPNKNDDDATGYSPTGTLTLATPGAYNSLSILAFSTNLGGGSTAQGTVVLTFTDGTTLNTKYNAYDWAGPVNGNAAAKASEVFSSANYFARTGTLNGPNDIDTGKGNRFDMFETDLNLAALGDGGKTLQSLAFSVVQDAGNANNADVITNIMGLSGVAAPAAAPEPSQTAALGLGVLGLAALMLRARRRAAGRMA